MTDHHCFFENKEGKLILFIRNVQDLESLNTPHRGKGQSIDYLFITASLKDVLLEHYKDLYMCLVPMTNQIIYI